MTIEFFGTKLKAVRKSKRLTQLDLAERLEVSKGTVSAYECQGQFKNVGFRQKEM
ncbi:helix-turn-helix domain-containing protein [Furfurilactobacillus cerevisiae]|uniref:helix-turn-helix domain-containing protein n=1 Tax=Furfurilactobacillus rossiae TaxID=231049 RepID=UPI003B983E32